MASDQGLMRWEIRKEEPNATVILRGDITENAEFSLLVGELGQVKGTLTVDTFEVRRINSAGVSNWVNFMGAIERVPQVRLVRCAPVIVAQLSSIDNFCGKARVESVCAPFHCMSCDAEQIEEIAIPQGIKSANELVAGPYTCPKCGPGSVVEFDDLADRYFKFALTV